MKLYTYTPALAPRFGTQNTSRYTYDDFKQLTLGYQGKVGGEGSTLTSILLKMIPQLPEADRGFAFRYLLQTQPADFHVTHTHYGGAPTDHIQNLVAAFSSLLHQDKAAIFIRLYDELLNYEMYHRTMPPYNPSQHGRGVIQEFYKVLPPHIKTLVDSVFRSYSALNDIP